MRANQAFRLLQLPRRQVDIGLFYLFFVFGPERGKFRLADDMFFEFRRQGDGSVRQNLLDIAVRPRSFRLPLPILGYSAIGDHLPIVLKLEYPFLVEKKKNGLLLPFLFVGDAADELVRLLQLVIMCSRLACVRNGGHGWQVSVSIYNTAYISQELYGHQEVFRFLLGLNSHHLVVHSPALLRFFLYDLHLLKFTHPLELNIVHWPQAKLLSFEANLALNYFPLMRNEFKFADSQIPLSCKLFLFSRLEIEEEVGVLDCALPQLSLMQNDIPSDKSVRLDFLVLQRHLFSHAAYINTIQSIIIIFATFTLIKLAHSNRNNMYQIQDENNQLICHLYCPSDFKLYQIFYTFQVKALLMWKTVQQFANWNDIREKLHAMACKKYSSEEIIKVLQEFRFCSYIDQNPNPKKSNQNDKFITLQKLYSKELPQIFSKVATFVLNHPKHQIPLFLQGQDKQFTLKKQTILYLYCTMALCLIPRQEFDKSLQARSKFNYLMDFSFIFGEEEFKTRTVIEYLKQEVENKKTYDQTMSIHRQVENRSIEQIIEQNKQNPMSKLTITNNQASIEDYYGQLKADFANKFLGGGALLSGCVQQEIMFTNHPQLFTAQLLCEVMRQNECIFLSGYKKYFKNKGYGWKASYDGLQTHKYKYDANNQAMEYITAIDALHLGNKTYASQFQTAKIDRQIIKAYCGFNFKNPYVKRVITGNWGCGAFGGNIQVKFMIQWLACSLANKEMVYCPFGERQKIQDQVLLQRIHSMKVGETYRLLHRACSNLLKEQKDDDIFRVMKDLL